MRDILCCDSCGGSLKDGYDVRNHGTDSATGYQDTEIVCAVCIEKQEEQRLEDSLDDDGRWDAGDAAYDMMIEDSL